MKVRWKIMGIVVAVILMLGGSVTYELAINYRKTLREEVQEKGLAISRSLAARSANLVLTNQRFALFELISEVQESGGDIHYVYIADKNGQPVVDTFGSGFPRDLLALPPPAPSEPYRLTRLSTESGSVQDIAVPILDGRGGTVHLGMSEARVQQSIARQVRTNILITIGVLIVGASGAFGLATVLTRPVEKLVEATEAVARGEFDKPAPVWATDELGQLGIAFNSMASELRRSSESLQQRNRDLEGLNALASVANRYQDIQEVMDSAVTQVRALTGALASWIALVHEDGKYLKLVAQKGLTPDEANAVDLFEASRCPCMDSSRSEAIGNVRPACSVRRSSLPKSLLAVSLICLPLHSQGRPLGVLNAVYEQKPGPREELLLLAVADQVGVALENSLLLAELRRKEALRGQVLEKLITAQEDERKRISRELHDETGQALTALSVTLKSMEALPLDEAARSRIANLQSLAAAALRGVHDLAIQLRPSVLDEAGLGPALERYVAGFAERYDIPTDLQVTGMNRRLPAATETALYRIAQEALTNIARHAGASRASVLLEGRTDGVLLLVEDDGRGFATAERDGGHGERLGIHGMEERAMLVGGTLTIESEPGAGTSVYVQVPLQEVEHYV